MLTIKKRRLVSVAPRNPSLYHTQWRAVYDAESIPIDTDSYSNGRYPGNRRCDGPPLIARHFPQIRRKDGSRRIYWASVVNAISVPRA